MDIRIITGSIQESDADAIVASLFEGMAAPGEAVSALDQALNGAITDLIASGDFDGSAGQVAVLYPRGAISARRVIVIGLGPQEACDSEVVRRAAAEAALRARNLKVQRMATMLHGVGGGALSAEASASAIAEGTLLALYVYNGRKPEGETGPQILELCVPDTRESFAVQEAVDQAVAIATSVALTRDLVNRPPNLCTPAYMAEVATRIGDEVGLRVQVLERGQMQALGMGALLAVAQGSETPPRFIIMEHNASRADELDSIVLVGKGVTFDTGGYSLKTAQGMATMKSDMAGGAAIIGAMRAVGALNLPLHVVGLVPTADNMISGRSYRPQDVVTASNGVTIEVTNTDAEGRMLLADALVFAGRFKPAAVVDIATLTGACVTALGAVAAGLFSTSDNLQKVLLSAAEATGERLWPLPLYPEYEKRLESAVADLKNSPGASTPFSGVGVSASFLKRFTDYPAWAHIDMAGMAASEHAEVPYTPKGATGYGTRLLVAFVRLWAQGAHA